jgi:formylglycine-generating enzyme required for sulfatase activity
VPPEGPTARIVRGGAFDRPAADARSARRHKSSPQFADSIVGLRAARELEE